MDIQGAEIFSVGKWNSMDFSGADLDAIAASFNKLALAGRVPLKFGHNEKQGITDGQPAIGWVSRVWRDGEKLLADFANVPKVVYEAIRDKLYNFVSVELLQDAERNGDKFPWVLSAVALLGADLPAVGNLSELSRLVMSRRAAMQFSRAGTLNLTGEAKRMATDAEKIAELEAKVLAFAQANEKLIADSKAREATVLRASAEQKFEAAIAVKRLLPAHRERFFKWTFPKDNEGVIAFDHSEVDRYIKENEVVPDENQTRGGGSRGQDEEGKTPDIVVRQRVRVFMSENQGVNYKDAMVAVLREDNALAEEYRSMPDKLYK